MTKKEIVKTLLHKKANNNNSIDLDAYATGLEDMYEYFIKKLEYIT